MVDESTEEWDTASPDRKTIVETKTTTTSDANTDGQENTHSHQERWIKTTTHNIANGEDHWTTTWRHRSIDDYTVTEESGSSDGVNQLNGSGGNGGSGGNSSGSNGSGSGGNSSGTGAGSGGDGSGGTEDTPPSLISYHGNPFVDIVNAATSTIPSFGLIPSPGLGDILRTIPQVRALDVDIDIDAGEKAAAAAQAWYAEHYVDPSTPTWQQPLYLTGGVISSLWVPGNSRLTAVVLTTALGVNDVLKVAGVIGENRVLATVEGDLAKIQQAAETRAAITEGTCFVAGTKVLTPAGLRDIETLKVGELVLACDPERGIVESRAVL